MNNQNDNRHPLHLSVPDLVVYHVLRMALASCCPFPMLDVAFPNPSLRKQTEFLFGSDAEKMNQVTATQPSLVAQASRQLLNVGSTDWPRSMFCPSRATISVPHSLRNCLLPTGEV